MNKVELTGRLTADPEIRYTTGENNFAIGTFTLAVNRKYVKKNDPNAQTADFIRCKTLGKTSEFLKNYFHKGMKADICGRIETGKYTNKDGQTVYTTDVVVEDLEFGESKGSGNETTQHQSNGFSGGYQNPNQSYMNIPEGTNEVLPFS